METSTKPVLDATLLINTQIAFTTSSETLLPQYTFMEMVLILEAISALLALFLLYSLWPKNHNRCEIREAPTPAGHLPIIGHLHKLGANQPLTITLSGLADKYGPIFTLWIGSKRTLVVSNWDLAKECFSTNDKIFASRSTYAAAKYLGYDYAMIGFAFYGSYWREVKKISTLELLSAHRLELLKHVRSTEVDLCIKDLYMRCIRNDSQPIKVEMKQWFGDLTFNNVVMNIAGKRFFGANVEDEKEARKFTEVMASFFYLMGNFLVSDAIPWLEWLDIGGSIRAMKETAMQMDMVMSTWLQEHKVKRMSGKHTTDQDFIDVMLSTMEETKFADYDPDTIIKAVAMSLILAGTDTTTVTMTWALTMLMNNRHVLEKAQIELDTYVGKERNVQESDIKNLPYLRAIVKETLRLYPAAPLSIPHESMQDCQIGGYHVPAGTRLMVNLWKIHRNPTIWPDPEEFRPERFLTEHADVDVRGQHFELIPFGSGRRMCPGISFALHLIHLTLARLLHGFELATPSGGPVDMHFGIAVTLLKATPLEVMCTPRLPSHLYCN